MTHYTLCYCVVWYHVLSVFNDKVIILLM